MLIQFVPYHTKTVISVVFMMIQWVFPKLTKIGKIQNTLDSHWATRIYRGTTVHAMRTVTAVPNRASECHGSAVREP